MCSRYERGLLICIMSWRKNTSYHLEVKKNFNMMMLPDSNLAARHRISEIVPCQLKESMCKKTSIIFYINITVTWMVAMKMWTGAP